MRFAVFSLLLLALASCALPPEKVERLTLAPVSFADLSGWQNDSLAPALAAFRRSCAALTVKTKAREACATAEKTEMTDDAARAYFENWFQPYAVAGTDGVDGLFTGYYMPELNGSLTRGGAFQTPLYERPADMITVDLGAFKSDLKGQRIVGKIQQRKLVPYDDRAEITSGSLVRRAQVLAWTDDPIGAFFLQIQGSGLIRLTNGKLLPVGYDGANGRAYVAIGRALKDRGDLPSPVTMPAIRAWLAAHPDKAQEILNLNPSYVFFRRLPNENAVGAESVALTPLRSLAVDPQYLPLGTPVWLDTTDGQGAVLQRLMIAQDTGGAIKGPVRGDVYWGTGVSAAAQAGAMQSRGRYYVLLPKKTNQ
ncbi:MAG: murein transglycosylase A [Alphaproteobacteria bacterium]|nr:murein transglycosylase A [Alphaproteobacteria bacterium]